MRQWCYSNFLSGAKDARTPQAAPPEQRQTVVKTPPWRDNTNPARRAHIVQYVRVLYEVSPELLEQSLTDVAVGLMLEDRCFWPLL